MNELKLKINKALVIAFGFTTYALFTLGALKSAHIQMLRQAGETGEANKLVLYFCLSILASVIATLYTLHHGDKLKAALEEEVDAYKEHTEYNTN